MKTRIHGMAGTLALGLLALCLSAQQLPAQGSAQTRVNAKDGQTYASIPAGKFEMGCSPTDQRCATDETRHTVQITHSFWMGVTPVTVAAWKRYREQTGKPALPAVDVFGRKINEGAGDATQPVVSETWSEAADYCSWAGMRLPTEAEWEYAARAGTTDYTYGILQEIAWYADNSGKKTLESTDLYRDDAAKYPTKLLANGNGPKGVGKKAPNAWGLYDMLGNVWQWVSDYYAVGYYTSAAMTDPAGPATGTQRVLRGGAWDTVPADIRVSFRLTNPPGDRVNDFGFRCAGNLP